jgi:hypothetical protein
MLRNWRAPLAVLVIVVATGLLAYWFCRPFCPTTVIVLRHAEKQDPSSLPDNQVPLTSTGQARAAELAQVLARAAGGVDRCGVDVSRPFLRQPAACRFAGAR